MPDGTYSSGALVSTLASTGGVSNTLTQGTSGRQPIYTTLGGRGAIDFDGTDDDLKSMEEVIMAFYQMKGSK